MAFNNDNWFQYFAAEIRKHPERQRLWTSLEVPGIFISSYSSAARPPDHSGADLTGKRHRWLPPSRMGASRFNRGLGKADLVAARESVQHDLMPARKVESKPDFPTVTLPQLRFWPQFQFAGPALTKLFQGRTLDCRPSPAFNIFNFSTYLTISLQRGWDRVIILLKSWLGQPTGRGGPSNWQPRASSSAPLLIRS